MGGPEGDVGSAGGPVAAGDGNGPEATFEELMAELEDVTARLAAGDLGIEAAADLYERAERLHAQAAARLERVQARVDRLTRADDSSDLP